MDKITVNGEKVVITKSVDTTYTLDQLRTRREGAVRMKAIAEAKIEECDELLAKYQEVVNESKSK